MIVIPTSVRTGFMWKKEELKGKSFGRKCLLSFFKKKKKKRMVVLDCQKATPNLGKDGV